MPKGEYYLDLRGVALIEREVSPVYVRSKVGGEGGYELGQVKKGHFKPEEGKWIYPGYILDIWIISKYLSTS